MISIIPYTNNLCTIIHIVSSNYFYLIIIIYLHTVIWFHVINDNHL